MAFEINKVNLIISLTNGNIVQNGVLKVIVSSKCITDDIKRFKEILDAKIITQEEFGAKKKQLLGI